MVDCTPLPVVRRVGVFLGLKGCVQSMKHGMHDIFQTDMRGQGTHRPDPIGKGWPFASSFSLPLLGTQSLDDALGLFLNRRGMEECCE